MVNAVSSSVTGSSQTPTLSAMATSVIQQPHAKAKDKLTQEQLYDPGLYALQQEVYAATQEEPYQEKHKFLKFLGKVVFVGIVACAAAYGARKKITSIKDMSIDKKLPEKSKLKTKIKYCIAKVGDWVEKTVKNIFKKEDAKPKVEKKKMEKKKAKGS